MFLHQIKSNYNVALSVEGTANRNYPLAPREMWLGAARPREILFLDLGVYF